MKKMNFAVCLSVIWFACTVSVHAQTTPMYRWVDAKGVPHYSDMPPPPDGRRVEERKLGAGSVDSTPSALMRKATEEHPVTLYTANGCGSPCESAKSLLTKRGIPFEEHMVRTKSEHDAYLQRFNGAQQVPGITIGTETQVGFEENRWSVLLDAAGYPKAGTLKPGTMVQ